MIPLRQIAGCFDGMIPPVVATCSADGVPNVVQLSQIHLIDDHHVALSNQFFGTTTNNIAENPAASVVVIEPATFESYQLLLEHVRSETDGAAFERMNRQIEAIASLTGMSGVFRLRALEVFRVSECTVVPAGPHEPGHG